MEHRLVRTAVTLLCGRKLAYAAITVSVLTACTASPDGAERPAPWTESNPSRFSFPTNLSEATVITDDLGRHWNARPVTTFATGAKAAEYPPLRTPRTSAQIAALTDDQYLEEMRPVKLAVDELGRAVEYTLAEWDSGSRKTLLEARAKERAGVRMRSWGPGRVQEFTGDVIPPPPADWNATSWNFNSNGDSNEAVGRTSSPLIINEPGCGGPSNPCDGRSYVGHSSAFAWPNIASVNFIPSGWGMAGSGTMIGRYTAMSCAHIFHQPWDKVPGTWYSTQTWSIALVHSVVDGGHKYTSGFPYQNPPGPTRLSRLGCYTVTIPNSYINGHSEGDFAIVEFGCGLTPGNSTGYMGPAYGLVGDYPTAPNQMVAYDADAPVPPSWPGPPGPDAYSYPTEITRSAGAGTANIDPTWNFLLQHRLDNTGGSSGGGFLAKLWFRQGDPTLYWVGDHVSGGSTVAYARALTAGSWGFIQAYSNEY